MSQSVLVTGSARRIGRAITEALAAQGWRVLVHARRSDDEDGRNLAQSLNGVFLSADLTAADAADRLFCEAVRQAPDLCAIVNNASVFSLASRLPAEEARALRRVNVDVPQRLTELLYKYLREQALGQEPGGREGVIPQGAVVDLLDTRILQPARNPVTPYELAKRDLFDSLVPRAKKLGDLLRVNAVALGPVLKPTSASNSEPGGATLLPARPTAADVAAAVAYLLSAGSVTGQIIAVDSGQSLLCTPNRYCRRAGE